MNVCVLYYDGFCEFEVVFAFTQFYKNIFSSALENRVYVSEENQKYLPDKTIQELNPEDIDLFIIPGGDTSHLFENTELKEFVTSLNEKNKFVASICGGVSLVAKYGVLNNKKCTGNGEGIKLDENNKDLFEKAIIVDKDVVIDGNCITSTGLVFLLISGGNGRISRVATLLFLYQSGFAVGRIISLEKIIEDSKKTYYEVLNKSSML